MLLKSMQLLDHCMSSAINWLDRSFSSGGSCTADLRALLHQHDAEFEACALSEMASSIQGAQRREGTRGVTDATRCSSRGQPELHLTSREWVETVQPHPSPAVIREQKELLFSECSL